jgi:hypothetical protein
MKYPIDRVVELTHQLQRRVVDLDQADYELYMCDETLFRIREVSSTAWARPNEHVRVKINPPRLKTLAVVGAISVRTG